MAKARNASKKAARPRVKSTGSSTLSTARIDIEQLATLLASLPSPGDLQRRAFRGQFSAERCATLGTKTRASTVELEAMRFAQDAAAYLRRPEAVGLRYTPVRLAWLLECIGALAAARQQDVARKTAGSSLKAERSVAALRAAAIGGELSLTLQDLAEGDDSLRAELQTARATASPAQDVLALLDAHAHVLEGWLRGTPELQALLDAARVDASTLTEAKRAAEQLRSERTRAQPAGNTTADSPDVNVAEGRVLYELRLLRKTFRRARERGGDPSIPALNPSPTLRRIFLRADAGDTEEARPSPPVA